MTCFVPKTLLKEFLIKDSQLARNCPLCKSPRKKKWCLDFIQCDGCDFVYKDVPKPGVFEEEYWGDDVLDPDGIHRNKSEERDHKISCNIDEIKYINKVFPCGGKILDVGAGLGHLLSVFNNDWEKHALEVSRYCCNFMGENYPDFKIFHGDLSIMARHNFYDVVYCHHVIEHMYDPVLEISRMYDVLKPGGFLFIVTPNIESWVCERFKENFRLLEDKTHISMFGEKSLNRVLMSSGFCIKKVNKPFFRTKYFTLKNILRLWNVNKVSPPFKGNVIYTYARKIYEIR